MNVAMTYFSTVQITGFHSRDYRYTFQPAWYKTVAVTVVEYLTLILSKEANTFSPGSSCLFRGGVKGMHKRSNVASTVPVPS